MGLILSDSQEVETGKRVKVFCLFDSRQLCGLPSVGGGLLRFMNFHFPRVSSLYLFQLTADFLRRLRLNSVLLRAKGSFVSFAWY